MQITKYLHVKSLPRIEYSMNSGLNSLMNNISKIRKSNFDLHFFRTENCLSARPVFNRPCCSRCLLIGLNLFYLPVFFEDDVLQRLPLKCHFCHICHDFPSLGITSTAYVVSRVGRVQNKWSPAWKNIAFQSSIMP